MQRAQVIFKLLYYLLPVFLIKQKINHGNL